MINDEKMVFCEFRDLKNDSSYSIFANDYEDLLLLFDKYPNRHSIHILCIEECYGFAIDNEK